MREGKVGCETLAWPNLSGWARPTGFASFCTLNGARVKYLYRQYVKLAVFRVIAFKLFLLNEEFTKSVW